MGHDAKPNISQTVGDQHLTSSLWGLDPGDVTHTLDGGLVAALYFQVQTLPLKESVKVAANCAWSAIYKTDA